MVGASIAILVAVGVALSIDRRPAPAKLPIPNGYDDLVRASLLMKGDLFHINLARPDLARLRQLVEANKASLELARIGLGRECVVPIENSQEGLSRHTESIRPLIHLSRLFQAVAISLEADGRFPDASKIYLEKVELGQAITRGGIGTDLQIGSMIQIQAIGGLRKLRDRLPKEEIPAILRELESVDKRRVSLKDVDDRWLAWYQGAYNPLMRMMYRWNGDDGMGRSVELTVARAGRERAARDLRFLLAELAIHAYHEDKRVWPRSLGDLVPIYLTSVPLDPVTGLPIDYPANPSGELTNDLSSIVQPDGEISNPSTSPAVSDPVGDGAD